jgi:hypothetical protein
MQKKTFLITLFSTYFPSPRDQEYPGSENPFVVRGGILVELVEGPNN